TLILAFAGSSFNMIITIYSYGVTFRQLINTDFVAVEIIRGIAGSMGIVMSVPAVSFIAAWILVKMKRVK
ncbi:MAG: YibE/F family protein, partial [Suipraeoptans sp.]